ncbi:MAG: hypothetical protein LEGION0398_MBIBDBAK_00452 [Legionellaceae bacterium]
MWKPITACLFFTFYTLTSKASINPKPPITLIEVNQKNKAQCTEFFTLKEKLYCSTEILPSIKIQKEIEEAETLNLGLDFSLWKIASSNISPHFTQIEYIYHGEKNENGTEFITTQFFPHFPHSLTLKIIALLFIKQLQQKGLNPALNFYKESNDTFIFEYQILSPEKEIQDTIQMIFMSTKGLHIINYTIKQIDMDKKKRKTWLMKLNDLDLKKA